MSATYGNPPLWELHVGDALAVLRRMPDASVDAVVTDPPYGLRFMSAKWDYDVPGIDLWTEVLRVAKPGAHLLSFAGTRTYHRMTCNIEDAGFYVADMVAWIHGQGFPKNADTQLKPALEPVCLARKPFPGTVAANLEQWGTGALNVDGCRIPSAEKWQASGELQGGESLGRYGDGLNNPGRSESHADGRWPANVIHDGSEEVEAAFARFGESKSGIERGLRGTGGMWSGVSNQPCGPQYGDTGTPSRFFFCAKASTSERGHGNNHPTVKPLSLMSWLCRLVTPPGGLILDPFAGSGSTGVAAVSGDFRFIGIEREEEYATIARRRICGAKMPLPGMFDSEDPQP